MASILHILVVKMAKTVGLIAVVLGLVAIA